MNFLKDIYGSFKINGGKITSVSQRLKQRLISDIINYNVLISIAGDSLTKKWDDVNDAVKIIAEYTGKNIYYTDGLNVSLFDDEIITLEKFTNISSCLFMFEPFILLVLPTTWYHETNFVEKIAKQIESLCVQSLNRRYGVVIVFPSNVIGGEKVKYRLQKFTHTHIKLAE
ncbi:hypothetical protein [Desulfoscipio geothermicus]|uniref:Uncharacterized protein n=1 Tax=Desulfoscipio geothermicus DSM 3669 TaxID=1121426 RepID=A0A1I6E2K8_9FIRM|nr:hypothetical protein [Desulfoscipio geothermicus]SFR11718.1 hypothetical protein SAMN05660706_12348 [Desulfoscipio geothermicus DSM 3669]